MSQSNRPERIDRAVDLISEALALVSTQINDHESLGKPYGDGALEVERKLRLSIRALKGRLFG